MVLNTIQLPDLIKGNGYFSCSEVSGAKFRQIVRHFPLDLTATVCPALTDIQVYPVNVTSLRIRKRMRQ